VIASAAGLITLSCLMLGFVLSALHACLVNLSHSELMSLAKERARRGPSGRVERILADIDGHARAVALVRIVCNLSVAVTSVWWAASIFGREAPVLSDALAGVGVSAILLWIFSTSVPDSIARHAAERFVYVFNLPIRAIYKIQKPLALLARGIDAAVRRLSGTRHFDKKAEIEDELLTVVEDSEREGAIDEREREMIEAVVALRSKTVEQIMTPRTEVESLELTNSLSAITAFVRKARHSRIPVHRAGGTLDDVVGFFYVKDLLRWLAGEGTRTGTGFDLKTILRPAFFVPETKTVRDLAREFVEKKIHIAVVADEFGGISGVVSLEDIVEEVFGDIQDEYEKPEDEPPVIDVKPDQNRADIDARAYIDDVNEALAPMNVALPEDDEYDTLGGFVLAHLGRMPETNESFQSGRLQVTVLEASPTRVLKVRLQVRPDRPPAGDDEAPASDDARPSDQPAGTNA
jgi:putative hemolysin